MSSHSQDMLSTTSLDASFGGPATTFSNTAGVIAHQHQQPQPQQYGHFQQHQQIATPAVGGPQASWLCHVCGNINKHFRSKCNMKVCAAPRGFPGPFRSIPTRNEYVDDHNWTCIICGEINKKNRGDGRCYRRRCHGTFEMAEAFDKVLRPQLSYMHNQMNQTHVPSVATVHATYAAPPAAMAPAPAPQAPHHSWPVQVQMAAPQPATMAPAMAQPYQQQQQTFPPQPPPPPQPQPQQQPQQAPQMIVYTTMPPQQAAAPQGIVPQQQYLLS